MSGAPPQGPTAAVPFSLEDPLPRGVAVLEASAGTGKTYTIEWLVVRYVAEGVPLPHLLVVTFTRAATAELRDRVRTRLVRAAELVERSLRAGQRPTADGVTGLLLAGGDADRRVRHDRLRAALADFDAATIATIHGFCQHVLGSLGLAADTDPTAALLEDERELIDTVVDDLLVRRFHGAGDDLVLSRRDAVAIARKVVGNPDALVEPQRVEDRTAALRVRFAQRLRQEIDHRKRGLGVLSFDDVLVRLARTVTSEGPEATSAVRRLRQQYTAVLVDEFQDTDPTQWAILDRVFAGGERPLVLIGDPKQAIYSFRGADVHAYLAAARAADPRHTLDTNYRSDAGLLRAYNTLFAGARLGHDEIHYREVGAPPDHQEPRLAGVPNDVPLQLRVVRRDIGLPMSASRNLVADPAREHVARDLAAHLAALLDAGATVTDRDGGGSQRRPLVPSDVAVLVRRNVDAGLVQRELAVAGVPAVINGVGSVFATPAAEDWLALLRALERPSSPSRARVAALSSFFGWNARRVAGARDDTWDQLHQRLHHWAAVLRDRSVASLWQSASAAERLPARLLGRARGERELTDLAHVAELLHATARADGLGVTALVGWLRAQIAEAGEDTQPDERARRLESDADAVQVMTVHRSKGLEFGVVYCPYLWVSSWFDPAVPVFHPEGTGARTVDVGGDNHPDFDDHRKDAEREQREEDLRLLYVALTRARHQAVVWWCPGGRHWESPLARVLFCRQGAGPVQTRGTPRPPDDDKTMERLGELAAAAGGTMSIEAVPATPLLSRRASPPPAAAALDAASLDRGLDHRWRRHSYSAITRTAHEAGAGSVGSEPGEPVKDDEAQDAAVAAGAAPAEGDRATGGDGAVPAVADGLDEAGLRAVACPLDGVGGGVAFGTFVHAVLEQSDFAADDLDAELGWHVDRQLEHRLLDVGDRAVLVAALRAMLQTPLGPLLGDVALRQVPRGDRRDELVFELPLAGGRDPVGEVGVAAIAALLRRHVPAGDLLAGYADRLDALPGGPGPAGLRGYLTGSIDCVLRLAGPRYAVVDYKTNWLGVDDEPLSAWHYRPDALAAAMMRAHYPLQALLYTVALHRYLRWRQPGYDPATHLAGCGYLFVRGMTGPAVPRVGGQPCGVFAWRPPAPLVAELSDLLDGRPSSSAAIGSP